jgi:hypothetical protein
MEAPRVGPRREVGSFPSTASRPVAPLVLAARRGSSLSPSSCSGRLLLPPSSALPDVADALAATLAHAATLAYEPVVAPCSLMNCGDVVHRR